MNTAICKNSVVSVPKQQGSDNYNHAQNWNKVDETEMRKFHPFC